MLIDVFVDVVVVVVDVDVDMHIKFGRVLQICSMNFRR
jgi:hypothetical protein